MRRLSVRLSVTTVSSCFGKMLVRVCRVRRKCLLLLLLLLLLGRWVFTMGLEVSETSDQGITYNMASHTGPELSAVV